MNIKKISAMAVSVIMAVSAAGCGSKQGKNKNLSETPQKGRYVESFVGDDEIPYPCEFVKADGKATFTAANITEDVKTIKKYTTDGDKISSEDLALKIDKENIYIDKAQVLPDGRGAVLYMDMSGFDMYGDGVISDETVIGDDSEEVTEEKTEEVTEKVSEEKTEEVTEEVSEEKSEEVSEEVTKEGTEETAEDDGSFEDVYDSSNIFAVINGSGDLIPTELKNIYDFEISDDGKLYAINFADELFVVDLNTGKSELIFQYTSNATYKLDIAGKYVIMSDMSSDEVVIYDTEAENIADGTEALNEFWQEKIFSDTGASQDYDFCQGEDGTIYIACTSGIYRYVIGGNKVEQLMDGSATSLSMMDENATGPRSMIYEGNDTFLVQCAPGLVRYTFDPDAEVTEQRTIKIFSLESSDQLNTAINTFRRAYPQIGVETEIGTNGGKSYEDAVKNLTTEIVSGDAPDVIILDGLNIQNLADKQLLEDLSETLDSMMPAEGLIENAALWNKKDGKLYSVAGSFEIPCVASNTEDPANLSGLKATANAAEKMTADNGYSMNLCDATSASFIKTMIDCYGSEISDGKGSVDAGKLSDFYSSCKKIYDSSDKSMMDEEWNNSMITRTSLNSLIKTHCHLGAGMLSSYPGDINGLTTIKDHNDAIRYRYGTSDANTFVPTMNAAVCTKSDTPDDAMAFIKTMLSKENQDNYVNDYLPVNTESFTYNFTEREDYGVSASIGMPGTEEYIYFEYKFTDEAEEEELMGYLNKMDTAVIYDQQSVDMLTEIGAKYLRGDTSLDDAVSTVRSFLELRSME